MRHTTKTDTPDHGEDDRPEWRESDCWPQCHCETCASAREADPVSRGRLPGLRRDGGER